MARLQEFLPTLLHHVEAEGLDHVHHRSTRSLTPAVRAAFAAARIRSAEAADVCGTASQAYLVLAPSGALR